MLHLLAAKLFHIANAVYIDLNNKTSIDHAAALIVQGTLDYYEGNRKGGTIGMFQEPYYWWEAGGVWGSMIDYWYITGNDTYVNLTKEAMIYQAGDDWDYIPLNQSTVEGNDDQAFWGIAAISAAERNFLTQALKSHNGYIWHKPCLTQWHQDGTHNIVVVD